MSDSTAIPSGTGRCLQLCAFQGDYANAALSTTSMIPVADLNPAGAKLNALASDQEPTDCCAFLSSAASRLSAGTISANIASDASDASCAVLEVVEQASETTRTR